MKTTTFVLRTHKIDPLYLIQLDKEVTKGVQRLGYDTDKVAITVKPGAFRRCTVLLDGEYFGIWDGFRKTFVD